MELPYREEWKGILAQHIRSMVDRSGAKGVIIAVNAEASSAVVSALASNALGADKVVCIHMTTSPEDGMEAYANSLGVEYGEISIEDAAKIMNDLGGGYGVDDNLRSRLRMSMLYYLANENDLLVLGTCSKTELLMGSFTKHGDGGVDMFPLGDLYKTQVEKMAYDLSIPADMLGKTEQHLDNVLWGIEHGWDDKRIGEDAASIREQVRNSAHKRGFGQIPKLGLRTIGIDWREDRSW